ncbi:MAG TPA: proprotein convertase P-domain-containing protein [Bryobacteraceae bacterium]|nr:proprotein convertase P-domain-containing protein [Bryobacteraceae bacterium]
MLRRSAIGAISLLTWVTFAVAQTAPVTVTYSYSGYPIYIPKDSANIAAVATIVVPDALKMTNVTAKVLIQYPGVGDLNVFLYSPDGTRVKLLERNCGSLQDVDTTFDDAAATRFADTCPVEAGRGPFRGNEPLANYKSADSSLGTWALAVENNGSDSRVGYLRGLTLQITGTPQLTPTFRTENVLNNSSVRGGVIVPGEYISILGYGMGPGIAVEAPAGTWPTSLGGVQVSINGAAVPLALVSSFRIDAQVPFDLATSGPASIQVTYNSAASAVVSVNTQLTFPGLFTSDPLGLGQAKAVNQDGTLNAVLAPARAGDVIAVYATGLGAVAPASSAGQGGPTNPLSVVTQPVAASIGGVPALVTFAGLAPGYVGVYQVNIQVPAGVPAGTRSIVISNAGSASQGLATVEIR